MEKNLSDADLAGEVRGKNCERSLGELIERHSPLCFEIFRKYAPIIACTGICPDDVIKEKDYIIYKCALSFRLGKKAKYSTWLANHMRYHCLNAMNRNRMVATEESKITFIMNANSDNQKTLEKEHAEFVLNIISQFKDQRIKEIFDLRYFSGQKSESAWTRIAAKIGVSTQTAINLHDKALRTLKQKTFSKNLTNLDKIF